MTRRPPIDLKKHPHPFAEFWARPGDCEVCSRGADDPIHVVKSPYTTPVVYDASLVWCAECGAAKPKHEHAAEFQGAPSLAAKVIP